MINMSVTEYINRYRIAQACLLFRKADNAMTDPQIAKEVGYDNYNYFVRMFTKCKGMSPREYKKNCADDNPMDWLGDSIALIADK
ncbi:MAG: AraC family transcriptional regulator, partial [Clostridiales bacterium]|nr:AraC family transcriptional regulator [Clostridiales bacterium]